MSVSPHNNNQENVMPDDLDEIAVKSDNITGNQQVENFGEVENLDNIPELASRIDPDKFGFLKNIINIKVPLGKLIYWITVFVIIFSFSFWVSTIYYEIKEVKTLQSKVMDEIIIQKTDDTLDQSKNNNNIKDELTEIKKRQDSIETKIDSLIKKLNNK